jgi:hypothetical protein
MNAADGQDLIVGVLRSREGVAPPIDEKVVLGSIGSLREPAVAVSPMPHDLAIGAFVSGVGARQNVMQDHFCVAPELVSYRRVNAL